VSFSKNAKAEIIKTPVNDLACAIAEISAVIKLSGSLNIEAGKISVDIISDDAAFIRRIYSAIKFAFKAELDFINIKTGSAKARSQYILKIPPTIAIDALRECRLIKEDSVEFINGIDERLVEKEECLKSYLRGCFLSAGSVSIPLKDDKFLEGDKTFKSNYHLEFAVNDDVFGFDLVFCLNRLNIHSKMIRRKNGFVVYIKEADAISDFLACVSASKAVLILQEQLALRSMRGKINRQTNCISANIDKQIEASQKQIRAINALKANGIYDSLNDKLKELCDARVENHEMSLEDLALILSDKPSKSGVNHRMRKILALSKIYN
jgi:DNA-binding protein WhiA